MLASETLGTGPSAKEHSSRKNRAKHAQFFSGFVGEGRQPGARAVRAAAESLLGEVITR